ncbi:MAG: hypothetical protein ACPKPY_01065 [Nitrososphaeraceae archaeon]
MIHSKQIIGILGIIFAVLGGISWHFQEKLPAFLLWAMAALLLFKLNKRRKNKHR